MSYCGLIMHEARCMIKWFMKIGIKVFGMMAHIIINAASSHYSSWLL